jgi:hypothetical protein
LKKKQASTRRYWFDKYSGKESKKKFYLTPMTFTTISPAASCSAKLGKTALRAKPFIYAGLFTLATTIAGCDLFPNNNNEESQETPPTVNDLLSSSSSLVCSGGISIDGTVTEPDPRCYQANSSSGTAVEKEPLTAKEEQMRDELLAMREIKEPEWAKDPFLYTAKQREEEIYPFILEQYCGAQEKLNKMKSCFYQGAWKDGKFYPGEFFYDDCADAKAYAQPQREEQLMSGFEYCKGTNVKCIDVENDIPISVAEGVWRAVQEDNDYLYNGCFVPERTQRAYGTDEPSFRCADNPGLCEAFPHIFPELAETKEQ